MESEEKNIKFLKLKLYRAYVGYIACLGKIYFVNIVGQFLKNYSLCNNLALTLALAKVFD